MDQIIGESQPGSGMTSKAALITGITGQDGSYLAELLLDKGYEVHGIIRRASTFNTRRIDHIYVDPHVAGARLFLHHGDLLDGPRLTNLLAELQPDEIYHLAAPSFVPRSWLEPGETLRAIPAAGGEILTHPEFARALGRDIARGEPIVPSRRRDLMRADV